MIGCLLAEGWWWRGRARGQGGSRKTWERVKDDMKLLGLHSEWAIFRDVWRDLIWGKRLTLA